MSAVTIDHIGNAAKQPVKIIRLGSGHRLTLGTYARIWRYVKDAYDEGVPTQKGDLTDPFDHRTEQPTAALLQQFRDGMHRRINIRGGVMPKGRKTTYEWETAAERVAQFVNGDPRVAYHPVQWRWIPHELRRAFQAREERGC